MNARKLLNFLKSPPGLLILFIVGGAFVLFLMKSCGLTNVSKNGETNKRRQELQDTLSKLKTGVPSAEFPNSGQKAASDQAPAPPPKDEKKEASKLTLYAAEQPVVRLSKQYAPFGRLVKCQLVITVDSSELETPIIAVVTEDVNHDGRLIIPAGTEVHGKGRKAHTRDRIGSEDEWVLVFREKTDHFKNGDELSLHGVALDMEEVVQNEKWSITDGSAGLRGEILKTDDFQELKLFVASAISGLSQTFSSRGVVVSNNNSIISGNNVRDSLLSGGGTAADRYAQMILDSIEKDGYYVRVAAGKQFYLYVTETIDQQNARIGSQVRTAEKKSNPVIEPNGSAAPNAATVPYLEGHDVSLDIPPDLLPQGNPNGQPVVQPQETTPRSGADSQNPNLSPETNKKE
jgi:hypothetical protein